ncbi:MAG: 54S ribosomal protein L39, mitochondrial, variant 2 [Marteilia pararefringens]
MAKHLRSNATSSVSESIKNAIKASNFNAKPLISKEEPSFRKFNQASSYSRTNKVHSLPFTLESKTTEFWNNHDIIKHRLEKFAQFKSHYVEERSKTKKEVILINMKGDGFTKYQVKAIKGAFTPSEGAKHISEALKNNAVAAVVNRHLFDLNRPIIEDSSDIEFCDLKELNVEKSYKVYWKTMQLIVSHIVELALPKDSIVMHLSSPWPFKSLGMSTFASDIYIDNKTELNIDKEIPQLIELLTKKMSEFIFKPFSTDLIFASKSECNEIFKFNKQKLTQIQSIQCEDDKLPIYKFGTHVDLSFGPLLPRSSFIGRTKFTAITKIGAYGPNSKVYRVQGVSVPSEDNLNDDAFSLLCKNAVSPVI